MEKLLHRLTGGKKQSSLWGWSEKQIPRCPSPGTARIRNTGARYHSPTACGPATRVGSFLASPLASEHIYASLDISEYPWNSSSCGSGGTAAVGRATWTARTRRSRRPGWHSLFDTWSIASSGID